jgi:hypothetical protein
MRNYINSKIKSISLVILAVAALAGCKKDKDSGFNANSEVQNTGDIVLNMPFGTNLTALTPVMQMPPNAVSTPASSQVMNFTGGVKYRITNGNVFKDYNAIVKIIPPLSAFKINGVNATINHENKNITLILPDGTNVSALSPEIALQSGASVLPASGVAQNFTQPINYTVTVGNSTVTYSVNVISNSVSEYAFLGTSASRSAITNPDEKAAADWFFATYPTADYVSFQSIETGKKLSNYKVIWWHFDSAQDLPAAATSSMVVNALKAYRTGGGSLLLTTFATKYVETLGVVPAGRGPNNVFGDFPPNGFVETGSDWGISFKGKESHPVFQGLETFEPGKAYLLEKGTFRLNHTAWWYINDWGGYGTAAVWHDQTGGTNLASEAWDNELNGRAGIAEWPSVSNSGKVIIVAFGAYDWYSEPLNGGNTTNRYLTNIKRITKNAIDYLKVK